VKTPHPPAGTSAAGRPGSATAAMQPAPTPAAALTIDALGRKCPIPIIMLAERIGEVNVGQLVSVLADDPAAKTDIPAWCMLKSHEFVDYTELPRGWSFQVRRSY
jgi:tRNA 2-thiouridine synthesizing protein A